jgi:hypothetical protein
MHWPNTKARDQVLAFRSNAKEFARNLHLVGFAEGKKENTAKFADLIDERNLLKYDTKSVAKEVWGL